MTWKPASEEDRFDFERMDDGGEWHPVVFVDLKPGDIFRAKCAGDWIDPISLELAADPIRLMCLEVPFKNQKTGIGYWFEATRIEECQN